MIDILIIRQNVELKRNIPKVHSNENGETRRAKVEQIFPTSLKRFQRAKYFKTVKHVCNFQTQHFCSSNPRYCRITLLLNDINII